MVFIRPQLLDDPGLMDAVTASRYSTIRDRQIEQRNDDAGLIRQQDTPLLPELESFLQAPAGDGGR